MFRIKICGIKTLRDALEATSAGADALGLNFYEQSPRAISEKDARFICSSLSTLNQMWGGHRQTFVGVFVNHSLEDIDRFAACGLSAIQLHGDEDPSLPAQLSEAERRAGAKPRTVIRVRRLDSTGLAAVGNDLQCCQRAGRKPDAVLLDSGGPGEYGGTGKSVPWEQLIDHPRWLGDTPLILAGGLTPDNVAEAIRIVRPAAVDVASGVESAPGKKDPIKVRDFIQAARAAFGE
jgi:phosphoribosylanthranilate isomerase